MKKLTDAKFTEYDQKLEKHEASYDAKLEVFLTTFKEDCSKEMKTKLQSKTDVSANNRKDIGEMKVSVNERISKIESELKDIFKIEVENPPIWNYLAKIEDRYTNYQTQIINSYDKTVDLLSLNVNKLEAECTALKSKQGLMDNELKIINHNVMGMKRDIVELKKPMAPAAGLDESSGVTTRSDPRNLNKIPLVNSEVSNVNQGNGFGSENLTNDRSPQSHERPNTYKTKLLICMDSNRKYINARKLWTVRGTTWKWCPLVASMGEILSKETFTDIEATLSVVVVTT